MLATGGHGKTLWPMPLMEMGEEHAPRFITFCHGLAVCEEGAAPQMFDKQQSLIECLRKDFGSREALGAEPFAMPTKASTDCARRAIWL